MYYLKLKIMVCATQSKHNYLNLEIDDEDAGRAWFTWTFYRLELF
jgi:hypothetical protein